MKICLLGNNLTNLVLANLLIKKKIEVDIISQPQKTVSKKTIRTIAISEENYKFLKKYIKRFDNLGWPTEKIKIFSNKNKSSELFEFRNKNSNNFYLVKYIEFYNLVKKNKLLKFIKLKNYNINILEKLNYNLVINSEYSNSITKKYFKEKIIKNYRSLAHTAIINHKKIENKIAIQILQIMDHLHFFLYPKIKHQLYSQITLQNHLVRKTF